MIPNEEQPTLLGYGERKQENLPAPPPPPPPQAATTAVATISPKAQAIIDKVDQASALLEQANNDYERLYVRDQAQAAMAAAEFMNLGEIVRQASVMVQRAERAIAKANPPKHSGRRPAGSAQDDKPALAPHTVQKMRQAHQQISDENFEAKVKQTLTNPEAPPLTRDALLKESREQRRIEQQAAEAARREQALLEAPPPDTNLLNIRLTELHKHVTSLSVDVIFTEPPYEKEAIAVYTDLAYFAALTLKPGGLLLILAGSQHLPEIYHRMSEMPGINYRHHFVYNAPSAIGTNRDARVYTKQQPLLCYASGDYAGEWQDDLIACTEQKTKHEEAVKLALSKFVTAGMVVCDPMMGQGAVGAAALDLGCSFIGSDINEDCVADAQQNIAAAVAEKARQDAENPSLPGVAGY